MSTFLVSLGVVAATIAAVLYVALNGPDQPATIRRRPSPAPETVPPPGTPVPPAPADGRRDGVGPPAPATPGDGATGTEPVAQPHVLTVGDLVVSTAVGARGVAALPVAPATASAQPAARVGPDSDAMRLRVLPAAPTTLWVRIRSGVALVVLVAVLGALLAMIVGAVLVGAAFLIRGATS